MPLVQVTTAEGTFNKQKQDSLMSRLSKAVIKAEGADANDPAALALVWAYHTEQPQGASYVGGEAIDRPPVVVTISTPQGALNAESGKSLVAEIGSIVDDLLGTYENRFNHWVLLKEVDEGNWGGAGQVFSLSAIQAAMNIKAA